MLRHFLILRGIQISYASTERAILFECEKNSDLWKVTVRVRYLFSESFPAAPLPAAEGNFLLITNSVPPFGPH